MAHPLRSSGPLRTWLALLVVAASLLWLKWPALAGYVAQRHHLALPVLEQAPAGLAWDEWGQAFRRFNGALVGGLNQVFYPERASQVAAAVPQPAIPPAVPATPERAALLDVVESWPVPAAAPPPSVPARSILPSSVSPSGTVKPVLASHERPPLQDGAERLSEPPALLFNSGRGPLAIARDDKVLFAGDSLMQGLVPFMAARLRSHRIAYKDLSKQSTGLAYPGFFDWPKAVRAEIEARNVTVLVVFLGANDAWGIIERGRSIAFNSAAWKDIYRQRVESMVDAAESAGVRVIWLGLPPMDNERLTAGAPVLNGVYQEVAARHGHVLLIPTDTVLTEDGRFAFTKFKKNPAGVIIRLRADDGIHFAPAGYRLLAELIWNHVEIL